MKKLWMVMILSMIFVSGCETKKVFVGEVYLTSERLELYLEFNESLMNTKEESTHSIIRIESNKTYQVIDGFGAAMTESSAYNLKNAIKKEEMLKALFSKEGINLNMVRLTMGSSDFSLSNQTYQPTATSPFSIESDRLILDILNEIEQDIKYVSSPWTAPAWMKDSQALNGGNFLNSYTKTYVNYFLNYLEAYQKEGIEIYAVTPQNEPLHQTPNYPSMLMSALVQASFIHELKTQLIKENSDVKIFGFDHNFKDIGYPKTLLNSKLSRESMDGLAFHCYDGDVSSLNDEAFEGIDLYITECSGGRWATHFTSNLLWNMENLLIGGLNQNVKGVMLWNLVLDENDGPKNGGCMNCRGVLTKTDQGYQKNVEYYALGHFSKFHQNGAKRIETTSSNVNILATSFKNPGGSIVLVAANKTTVDLKTSIYVDGAYYQYTIPKESVITIEFK